MMIKKLQLFDKKIFRYKIKNESKSLQRRISYIERLLYNIFRIILTYFL